jgi:hypothetical protein
MAAPQSKRINTKIKTVHIQQTIPQHSYLDLFTAIPKMECLCETTHCECQYEGPLTTWVQSTPTGFDGAGHDAVEDAVFIESLHPAHHGDVLNRATSGPGMTAQSVVVKTREDMSQICTGGFDADDNKDSQAGKSSLQTCHWRRLVERWPKLGISRPLHTRDDGSNIIQPYSDHILVDIQRRFRLGRVCAVWRNQQKHRRRERINANS